MVIGNMRYIEIDSIIEQIKAEHCERCTNHRCTLCDIDEVLILLEEADDADVEEVKHGEWEERKFIVFDSEIKIGYRCSACNTTWDTETNYCPNCGAKMDERKGE